MVILNDLEVLSASRIKTFVGCAKRFEYQYIHKVPSKKHPAAVLGTAVHRSLEHAHSHCVPPITSYAQFFKEESAREEIIPDTDLYLAGIDMLSRYNVEDKPKPLAMEFEFKLPFPDTDHPICVIHGFLDQVHEDGFIDFKTNKRKPTKLELANDLQFIIYAWAFEQLYGKSPTRRTWYHLRTGQELSADVLGKTEIAYDAIERLLSAEIAEMYDKNPTYACRWCPFESICLPREQ